jgi:hypothetical protein
MTQTPVPQKPARTQTTAWTLAVVSFVHGVLLLGNQRFWEGGGALFVASVLFFMPRISSLFRLTAGRAKFTLFLQLVFLGFVARYANWFGSEIFVVVDVVVLAFLQTSLLTPEDAPVDFWKSVKNAFQLAVPIAAIVLLIFKFYPEIKSGSTPGSLASTSFGLSGELNPGAIESLSESTTKAFVATFPKESRLPHAENLYWRGQVLTKNDGMHWRQDSLSFSHSKGDASDAALNKRSLVAPIEHHVRLPGRFMGFLFSLDVPVSVQEETNPNITVQPLWGHTYWKPSSVWKSREIIVKSVENGFPEQAPTPAERQALLTFGDARLRKILPEPLAEGNAETALDNYFGTGKFAYTLSPGAISNNDVWEFLQNRRRGFCEHYAASAANLLRASNIPARIVTGYFGGEWSEWDRTLVVREKHAHAWVEFWSDSRSRWIRYDAVRVLSPERMRDVLQTFSSTTLEAWFAAAFQSISHVFESTFEFLDASSSSIQELLPGIDVEVFLIVILLVPGIVALAVFTRKFIHEYNLPARQLERLAKDFREHIQMAGIEVLPALTFRQMAHKAAMQSPALGETAMAFVEMFEEVHYANKPFTGPLKTRMKAALKKMVGDTGLEPVTTSMSS